MKPIAVGMIAINEADMVIGAINSVYSIASRIVIVEGADVHYEMASNRGLSLDATADVIRAFPDPQRKITFIQHGWAGDDREGSGKVDLRQRYASELRDFDGWLLQMDADERYNSAGRLWLQRIAQSDDALVWCAGLQQAHFWKREGQIILGGYFSLPHARIFRFRPGTEYVWRDESSHNAPEYGGCLLTDKMLKRVKSIIVSGEKAFQNGPVVHHYGFCRDGFRMKAKNAYYVRRGEAKSRPMTTECRQSWFADSVSSRCTVLPWCGQSVFD